jgi:hypothetical protein
MVTRRPLHVRYRARAKGLPSISTSRATPHYNLTGIINLVCCSLLARSVPSTISKTHMHLHPGRKIQYPYKNP